jgi:hypothetical protein
MLILESLRPFDFEKSPDTLIVPPNVFVRSKKTSQHRPADPNVRQRRVRRMTRTESHTVTNGT